MLKQTKLNRKRNSSENIVDDPVLLRILELIRLHGYTEKEVENRIGLSNGAFTKWKYHGVKTYLRHIGSMSECLGVTPNYLLYGIDEKINTDMMSPMEINLIKLYRKMDERQKDCLIRTAKVFVGED